MLEAARREAMAVLVDQRLFLLDDRAYRRFTAALDAVPTENPRLRRLLRAQARGSDECSATRDRSGAHRSASRQAGIRAVLLHAMTADAKRFYQRAGFQEFPLDPMTMMITIADVERALATP